MTAWPLIHLCGLGGGGIGSDKCQIRKVYTKLFVRLQARLQTKESRSESKTPNNLCRPHALPSRCMLSKELCVEIYERSTKRRLKRYELYSLPRCLILHKYVQRVDVSSNLANDLDSVSSTL
jgi:hypothetical protein